LHGSTSSQAIQNQFKNHNGAHQRIQTQFVLYKKTRSDDLSRPDSRND
jgi:hypothetical protein